MSGFRDAMQRLTAVAEDPGRYADEWKRATAGRSSGLPDELPAELIHAAGALPVVVQENREPITAGRELLYEYYCGVHEEHRGPGRDAASSDVFDAFLSVDIALP